MEEKKDSKEPTSQEPEIPQEKSPMPNMENYIHPIDIDYLQSIQEIIELVLKNYAIDNPDEIGSKIIFIIKNLTSKSECFNQKGLRETIEFNLHK